MNNLEKTRAMSERLIRNKKYKKKKRLKATATNFFLFFFFVNKNLQIYN